MGWSRPRLQTCQLNHRPEGLVELSAVEVSAVRVLTDGWTDRRTDGRTLPSTLSPSFVVDNQSSSYRTTNFRVLVFHSFSQYVRQCLLENQLGRKLLSIV